MTVTNGFRWRLPLIAALAPTVAGAVLLGLFSRGPDAGTAGIPPGSDPVDVAFTYFNGDESSLAELRGKPVVLNFWASWCPACVAEMPDFQEVSGQFAGRVQFLGMNMQEVSLEAAQALVEATGVSYPLAHDTDGAIFQQFGGVAMPTTVFITASGDIARVHAGAVFASDLTAMIEQLLLAA